MSVLFFPPCLNRGFLDTTIWFVQLESNSLVESSNCHLKLQFLTIWLFLRFLSHMHKKKERSFSSNHFFREDLKLWNLEIQKFYMISAIIAFLLSKRKLKMKPFCNIVKELKWVIFELNPTWYYCKQNLNHKFLYNRFQLQLYNNIMFQYLRVILVIQLSLQSCCQYQINSVVTFCDLGRLILFIFRILLGFTIL